MTGRWSSGGRRQCALSTNPPPEETTSIGHMHGWASPGLTQQGSPWVLYPSHRVITEPSQMNDSSKIPPVSGHRHILQAAAATLTALKRQHSSWKAALRGPSQASRPQQLLLVLLPDP